MHLGLVAAHKKEPTHDADKSASTWAATHHALLNLSRPMPWAPSSVQGLEPQST